ncbi:sulfur carrier protein ThiS [Candidatus Nanohalococcus occultus]|uniref:sulfur carrier protein ThiS n=1 Tax=Candidatus Nanohalococcus occultus TaxID=2978047 RepID=UPI0039DF676F
MKITLVRDDLEKEVEKDLELDDGSTVKDLLGTQGIASEEVLVSIDGTVVSKSRVLEDGDSIKVFDVIAGG